MTIDHKIFGWWVKHPQGTESFIKGAHLAEVEKRNYIATPLYAPAEPCERPDPEVQRVLDAADALAMHARFLGERMKSMQATIQELEQGRIVEGRGQERRKAPSVNGHSHPGRRAQDAYFRERYL